jgi:predicted ATPase
MKLDCIELKGFKSIDGTEGQTIPFGDVTVLLGANGSGKSNLVSFFKMLNYMMSGALQEYVGKYGAQRILFYGTKKTESISFKLNFSSPQAEDTYSLRLSFGLPDRLFVSGEQVTYWDRRRPQPQQYFIDSGASETGLQSDGRKTSGVLYGLLSGIRAYQFHDTSDGAHIKEPRYVEDAHYLRHDAGNIAPFLLRLKSTDGYQKYYERIVRHIQRVMPQFHDFVLAPAQGNRSDVLLNWIDSQGSDYLFGPDQISDGSIRFMALATLLLQPKDLLPKFIVLDEPELGLHPAALSELAGMIQMASANAQVLIATQSTRLVDEFSANDVVVVERDDQRHCSVFKRLDENNLADWLKRYSLSELWEKNVLGGQP